MAKRKFKQGQTIYVVDCWGTDKGTAAIDTTAMIVKVNEKEKVFEAVLYGDTYQKYSFEDYGCLVFGDRSKAVEAAAKIPKPQTMVYQVIGNRVYTKKVIHINDVQLENGFDLKISLNRGKDISIKEIGVSLFHNKEDARKSIQ